MSPRPGSSTLMTSAPSQPRICVHDGPAWTCVMSSTLIPSSALRTFGSAFVDPFVLIQQALLVHRLVHRAGSELVRIDPDVDQRDLARRCHGFARTLQRGT